MLYCTYVHILRPFVNHGHQISQSHAKNNSLLQSRFCFSTPSSSTIRMLRLPFAIRKTPLHVIRNQTTFVIHSGLELNCYRRAKTP